MSITNDEVNKVTSRISDVIINSPIILFRYLHLMYSKDKKERKFYRKQYIYKYKQMSFKKNPTVEELRSEVEALQHQVITLNARLNSANKSLKNHPAQKELDALKAKWWYKLITLIRL